MTEITGKLSTALADRYKIERRLGEGGMATVYLADDLRHERKVALKVLKAELAAVLGAERFVQEIKTTASLQHPHILPLFDSGTAGGLDAGEFLYYVMPYVEGETLREKLDRETQLGIDEAVRIATEVADALDYAHRHGVIHRDIKPENILLHDGRPMVADFGIALAVSAAGGGRMTETGLSLGTPHYMSPEQATAEKDITNRSDIYSLGSVLYEMLAGEPPHLGGSAQAIIMKIVTEEAAPVTRIRKSVPTHVAEAVATSLERLPADRFATAADFGKALQGQLASSPAAATRPPPVIPPERWRTVALAAGAAAITFAAVAAWALIDRGAPTGITDRVEFAFRSYHRPNDRPLVAISPDGRKIAQAIEDSTGARRIVVRELGSTELSVLPGSEGVTEITFSPDGNWIAFMTRRELRVQRVGGGPSTVLADSVLGGVAWGPEGNVLLYSRLLSGLWQIPADGGRSQRITTVDSTRREFAHWQPQVLPGGRTAIFNSFSTPIERSLIEAVDLSTGERTVLVDGAVHPLYVPSGHLLFARDGVVFAVRFDPDRLRVLGPEVPVIDDVAWSFTNGEAGYAVSESGTLAYLKGSEWDLARRVVQADRSGDETPLLPDTGLWAEPRFSPDGRWLAVTRLDPARQIWLYDLNRRILAQLTRTAGNSFSSAWMPDSRSVLHVTESPVYDIYRTRIDGSVTQEVIAGPFDKFLTAVSPDARTLLYFGGAFGRLTLAPMSGGEPVLLDERSASQRGGAFSPDGRWVAYAEVAPDQIPQVYVRSLAGETGRRQVSPEGGSQPLWTRGGREIVYRNGDAVLAVSFEPATGEVGTPEMLFRKPDAGRLARGRTRGYDVTPDGSRFVLVVPVERPDALPTVVVLNWLDELKRMVPR